MIPHDWFSCERCGAVLLVVMDPSDPGLQDEIAAKVDGHVCEVASS